MNNILKKVPACQPLRVLFRFISITRIRVAIFTNTYYAFTHVLLMCLFNGLFMQQISLGQVLRQHCVKCVDKPSKKKKKNKADNVSNLAFLQFPRFRQKLNSCGFFFFFSFKLDVLLKIPTIKSISSFSNYILGNLLLPSTQEAFYVYYLFNRRIV